MRLSVATKNLVYNQRGHITQTFKELRQQFLLAAQDLIQSVAPAQPTSEPWAPFSVPIDTGMARGSFLNLLQLLTANGLDPAVYIPTIPQRKKKYRHTRGYKLPPKLRSKIMYDGTIEKTPKHGAALSTSRGQIVKRMGNKFVFKYETNVKHFNIHDPGLWRTFENGRRVFTARLMRFKPPQLEKYLVTSNVSSVENRTVK